MAADGVKSRPSGTVPNAGVVSRPAKRPPLVKLPEVADNEKVRVRPGQTASSIVADLNKQGHKVTLKEFLAANPGVNSAERGFGHWIYPNDELRIPKNGWPPKVPAEGPPEVSQGEKQTAETTTRQNVVDGAIKDLTVALRDGVGPGPQTLASYEASLSQAAKGDPPPTGIDDAFALLAEVKQLPTVDLRQDDPVMNPFSVAAGDVLKDFQQKMAGVGEYKKTLARSAAFRESADVEQAEPKEGEVPPGSAAPDEKAEPQVTGKEGQEPAGKDVKEASETLPSPPATEESSPELKLDDVDQFIVDRLVDGAMAKLLTDNEARLSKLSPERRNEMLQDAAENIQEKMAELLLAPNNKAGREEWRAYAKKQMEAAAVPPPSQTQGTLPPLPSSQPASTVSPAPQAAQPPSVQPQGSQPFSPPGQSSGPASKGPGPVTLPQPNGPAVRPQVQPNPDAMAELAAMGQQGAMNARMAQTVGLQNQIFPGLANVAYPGMGGIPYGYNTTGYQTGGFRYPSYRAVLGSPFSMGVQFYGGGYSSFNNARMNQVGMGNPIQTARFLQNLFAGVRPEQLLDEATRQQYASAVHFLIHDAVWELNMLSRSDPQFVKKLYTNYPDLFDGKPGLTKRLGLE